MRVPSEEVGLRLVQELHNRHVPFRAGEPERRRARLRDLVTPATPTLDPLFLRNFGELVLGCIDSYDSESRRIFKSFFEIYEISLPSHR